MKYDYLIVGAGLYGSVFAHEAVKRGKRCMVIDKRNHVGGNAYTENIEGINVHRYGAHIFHTKDKEVWKFVNSFAEFNNYVNSPLAFYKDEIYNLPFNMNTFSKLWGTVTPEEARAKIESQIAGSETENPGNLEEQAINLVGMDIYEKFIKGYTEKQWGRKCSDLPAFIIRRIPLRFTYDNNYFDDPYQGIPVGGYTKLFEKLLEGTTVETGVDFFDKYDGFKDMANKIVFTGAIDEYYGYRLGVLEYRSLEFDTEIIDTENFQGNAVVNYTEREVPFTRIIEHKHFEFGKQANTVVTREYPKEWNKGDEPFYPVNDDCNEELYGAYEALAKEEKSIIFGGRLGTYRYLDMDKVIRLCLDDVKREFGE